MKRIRISISNTFSQTIDTQNIDTQKVQNIDGKMILHLGTINISSEQPEFEIVRDNGAQILYGVLSIEQKIESILSYYLFGPVLGVPKPEKDFFNNAILQTDKFTFSFKKSLLSKIIDKHDFLIGEDKDRLQGNLDAIMRWRNAFAHGHLIKDNSRGFTLNYYAGIKKTLLLDDPYWQEVENCFSETEKLFKKLDQSFSIYLIEKIDKREIA